MADLASTTAAGRAGGASRRGPSAVAIGAVVAVVLAGGALAAYAVGALGRSDPEIVWAESEVAVQATRWDDAEAGLRTLAGLRRPTPADRMLAAQVAMGRGRTDDAIARLAEIPDADRLGPQARLLAGQLDLRRGRLRPAEERLRRAETLDPRLMAARKELIYLYGMQVRRDELDREFRAIARTMPLTFEMARIWGLSKGSIWEPAAHAVDLRKYLDADPDDRRTRLALAEMLQQRGSTSEAAALLGALDPRDPGVLSVRARIAFDRGHPEEARRILADAPSGDAGLARLRGRLALLGRDPKAAVAAFEEAERLDPRQRESLYGLGHAFRLLGDEARAAPYLKRAAAVDRLGQLLQKASTRAAHEDKSFPVQVAAACEAADRLPEARAWTRIALDADPLDESLNRTLYRLGPDAP